MDATGIPALDTLLVWGGAITVLAGVVTVVWRAVRGLAHFARRVEQFMDDWAGQPARAGVPVRPGVMERMAGMEERLGRVEHELYPNTGHSLRDAVDLANHRLARLCPDDDCRNGSGPRLAGADTDDLHGGPDGGDRDDDSAGDEDGNDQGEGGGGTHTPILPPRRAPDQGNHSQG
ncbi:hypothetical protein [Streptomyces sp. AD55]|uniref:hypothetical protein n=1 Tax=Streptomyces sp. AD55 TaxID=3242895 RepID=UPI003527A99B